MMIELFDKNIVRDGCIPVVYGTDDEHIILTYTSMVSIAVTTSKNVDFVIFYTQLSEESIKILDSILSYSHCNIVYLQLKPTIFSGFVSPYSNTLIGWFSIIIPYILSKIGKAIYLGNSTFVRGDISELYDIKLRTNFLAAVNDVWNVDYNVKRLNMKSSSYFNTDVLLMNCNECRRKGFYDIIADVAWSNVPTYFRLPDVLNAVVDKKKHLISTKYNYIETWWHDNLVQYKNDELADYNESKNDPLIVNFTVYNPNDKKCKHSFTEEWWTCLKMTPFYEEEYKKYCS